MVPSRNAVTVSAYQQNNSFGAYIRYLRERRQLKQGEVFDLLSDYFEQHHVPVPTKVMFSKLERGIRAPLFEELLPLYHALVDGCDIKISAEERRRYISLAKEKIESLQRRRPKLRPESEWRLLEIQLAQLQRDAGKKSGIELVSTEGRGSHVSLDVSHIIGRQSWQERMRSYLEAESAKKLVVIRGVMGLGKTSGLKLLLHSLLQEAPYRPLFYSFSSALEMTSEDHLNAFLATLVAELADIQPEVPSTLPLSQRIEQALKLITKAQQRIVLLLDDLQVILDQQGQLPECWKQWFTIFLQHRHQAIIYAATREWPLWDGRERAYVVDGDEAWLPPLDQDAGIGVWRRLGFIDVDGDLLRQATERCGGNPLMIELRAASLRKPRLSFSWQRNTTLEFSRQKSERQSLIESLLSEPRIFGAADVEASTLLRQVIGHRLSRSAMQLLETLSVTPLALPFPLLAEVVPQQTEFAFVELMQASLINQEAMTHDERASLHPLVREAGIQRLAREGKLSEREQHLIDIYRKWLEQGSFKSEQEQSMVITELAVICLKHHRLLEVAELLVEYGWLSFAYGSGPRLARITDDVLRSYDWRSAGESEVGGLILRSHLMRFIGGDLAAPERKEAYLRIYEVIDQRKAELWPRTFVHVLHHKLRYMVAQDQFAEAWSIVDHACQKYEHLKQARPITYAELLQQAAYVSGRWGDFLAEEKGEEARRLRGQAAHIHQECVRLLRMSDQFASPLQHSHICFKQARYLNDLSYYLRCVGQLDDAMRAMQECLRLKEAGFTMKASLAVSYDDYASLLTEAGRFQEALQYRNRALEIIQQQLDEGARSAVKEQGMLFINQGKVFLLLGRLQEAEKCFQQGIPLVEGTSRRFSGVAAKKGLLAIQGWREECPQEYLDYKWFDRYSQLASCSDVELLSQAGPFSASEQQEWADAVRQRNDETKRSLIACSRKREIAESLSGRRAPCFHYPMIQLDDIEARLSGFSQLQQDVERGERNAIVRCFYLRAIEERLNELRMIAATARGDDEAFLEYSRRLCPVPDAKEMEIALSPLAALLQRGLECDDTRHLSQQIVEQIQQWRWKLHPLSLTRELESVPAVVEDWSVAHGLRKFSPDTVQRFFADVFRQYRFPWTVVQDPASESARVSLTKKQLVLPQNKQMGVAKIRQLLGHEIEIHAFRSIAGEQSALALLSVGLDDFLPTEEGLATYYTQNVAKLLGDQRGEKWWPGTLAVGLAAGVICKPFSYLELQGFLEQIFLLRVLIEKKRIESAEARDDARNNAQRRCLRTFRGITHLTRTGFYATKDGVYLRGFLAVSEAINKDATVFDSLMCGAASLHHLKDLGELGITGPRIAHKRLALDPDLEASLLRYEQQ